MVAVDGVSLDIAPGEFVTLLGPSGSGKTTTLMMLAGFEIPTAGEIYVDEDPIAAVPPYRRNIGMVFQNYALFPHMTVGENIAFPLQMRKMSRAEITRQTTAVLAAGRAAGLRGTLSAPALGRPAAAGRRGAGARLQPARAADGRAARRPRQTAAGALAARDQGAPRPARRDHHLRDPRPGRSAGHVRPHRGDERRAHRAVRAAHRALRRAVDTLRGDIHRGVELHRRRRRTAWTGPPPASRPPVLASCAHRCGRVSRPGRRSRSRSGRRRSSPTRTVWPRT